MDFRKTEPNQHNQTFMISTKSNHVLDIPDQNILSQRITAFLLLNLSRIENKKATPNILKFVVKEDYFGRGSINSKPPSSINYDIKQAQPDVKENDDHLNDRHTSILLTGNRQELRFRSQSFMSIIASNGREYFDHCNPNIYFYMMLYRDCKLLCCR